MPEAGFSESRHHGEGLNLIIIACFGLCGRDVADGLEQAAVVKPLDPFQGRKLDFLQRAPRASSADHLRFVEAVDALGQGVAVAVADAADGGFDACFGQALGVANRDLSWTPRSLW